MAKLIRKLPERFINTAEIRRKRLRKLVSNRMRDLKPEDTTPENVAKIMRTSAKQAGFNAVKSIPQLAKMTGLELLWKNAEEWGLTHSNFAKRLVFGVNSDRPTEAVEFSKLWARLRYPEAWSVNMSIDNRRVNIYENMSDAELEQLLQQQTEDKDKPVN